MDHFDKNKEFKQLIYKKNLSLLTNMKEDHSENFLNLEEFNLEESLDDL